MIMAENKQYAKWIDVPDGSGSLQRKWIKDEDARDNLLYPVNVASLTPSSTFVKNAIIGINGVIYRATANTSNFPVTLTIDNGQFVYDEVNGKKAFVVSDPTVNQGWEIFTDAGVEYWIEQKADIADVMAHTITKDGKTYTVQQLLEAVVYLMGRTVVLNQ